MHIKVPQIWLVVNDACPTHELYTIGSWGTPTFFGGSLAAGKLRLQGLAMCTSAAQNATPKSEAMLRASLKGRQLALL